MKEAFLWTLLAFASAWCLKGLTWNHLKINSQLESFNSLAANPDEDQFVSMNSQERFLFLSLQCQNPNRQVSFLFFFPIVNLFLFYFIPLAEVQLSTTGLGNCFISSTKFEYTYSLWSSNFSFLYVFNNNNKICVYTDATKCTKC